MAIETGNATSQQELISVAEDRRLAYWWVNQGTSYPPAKNGGYLWAPRRNTQGQTRVHWTNMTRLQEGDRVFHYANGALRAISWVTQAAREVNRRPEESRGSQWAESGWFARVQMEELDTAVSLSDLPSEVRDGAGSAGPFDSTGGVKQGYLFSVEDEAGQLLDRLLKGKTRHSVDHVLPSSLGGAAAAVEQASGVRTAASVYEEIARQGFYFPDWLVTDYILSLATKPLVILSGISGTGKTKLAQIVARLVAPDEAAETVMMDSQVGDEGSFVHTVGMSTLKYRGLTLPVASLALFQELPQKGERIDFRIRVNDGEDYAGWMRNIDFSDPSQRTAIQMFWDKGLGSWLLSNAAEGDYLVVTPTTDHQVLGIDMKLRKPRRVKAQVASSRIAFLSVRPDWTDNRSLLGYYNPLTARYQSTELLALLLRAKADPGQPYFVILDEMNLAKVEYYFSDFLSALEAGTEMILHDSQDDLFLDEAEIMSIPRRTGIPKNVFFAGTVNVDETTYMFSPKVLDRANVIEFNDVDLHKYPEGASTIGPFRLRPGSTVTDLLAVARLPIPSDWVDLAPAYKARLRQLHGLLVPYHLHFGYRVANEIARYMNLASEYVDPKGLDTAFDLQLLQKVFPKLAGNRAKLEKPLIELLGWCCDPDAVVMTEIPAKLEDRPRVYPHSAGKLRRMVDTLRSTGFVSFVE
jgi:5-methylcytosine-specific restriction enzyme B